MTVSRLSEDDFSTTVSDLGEYIELPIIELNEGDYIVAYGHIEKEEFLEYCNTYNKLNSGDEESYFTPDYEVLWTYAKRKSTPGLYDEEWQITWKNVEPSDEDAFPITLVNTW